MATFLLQKELRDEHERHTEEELTKQRGYSAGSQDNEKMKAIFVYLTLALLFKQEAGIEQSCGSGSNSEKHFVRNFASWV